MRATPRITFSSETVNVLLKRERKALQMGDVRLVQRLIALIMCAEGFSRQEAARLVGVSAQSVYNWVKAWMVSGVDSLVYKRSSGRPPKLTKSQKRRLQELIEAGPVEPYAEFRRQPAGIYIPPKKRKLGWAT